MMFRPPWEKYNKDEHNEALRQRAEAKSDIVKRLGGLGRADCTELYLQGNVSRFLQRRTEGIPATGECYDCSHRGRTKICETRWMTGLLVGANPTMTERRAAYLLQQAYQAARTIAIRASASKSLNAYLNDMGLQQDIPDLQTVCTTLTQILTPLKQRRRDSGVSEPSDSAKAGTQVRFPS